MLFQLHGLNRHYLNIILFSCKKAGVKRIFMESSFQKYGVVTLHLRNQCFSGYRLATAVRIFALRLVDKYEDHSPLTWCIKRSQTGWVFNTTRTARRWV
jgi:hypothetical protein